MECRLGEIVHENEAYINPLATSSDLAAHRDYEAIILRQNTILRSINKIYEAALYCQNEQELGTACLQLVEVETGAAFGFIYETGREGCLTVPVAFKSKLHGFQHAANENGCGLNLKTLCDMIIKDGKSLLVNFPIKEDGSLSVFPEIAAFLGVPFVCGHKVAGIIAVADRLGGFRAEDEELLKALAPTIFEVLFRKRTEKAMRENELLMRTIMESASDFMFIKDKDSRIVMVNHAYGKVFGVDINSVIGKNDYDLYSDPEMVRKIIENDQYVMQTGEVLLCEESAMTMDGYKTYSLSKVPWRDTDGKILGILGVAHDITKLKHTEASLQDMVASLQYSKKYIGILYETTGALLKSVTPRREIAQLCSKVMGFLDCHVFFNYLLDENETVMHLNACEGIPQTYRRQVEHLTVGAIAFGWPVQGESVIEVNIQEAVDPRAELLKSFGIRAYIRYPLSLNDKTFGSLSFGTRSRDRFREDERILLKTLAESISVAISRKENEETLIKQAEELKRADNNKNEFFAAVSHELRNPLATIMAGISLLDIADDEGLQKKAKSIMKRQTKQLSKLVEDLLDITRITQQKIELKKERLELNGLVFAITDDVRNLFEEKKIRLETSLHVQPIYVYADPVRLHQIIGNLLHNASKFTDRGGVVEVSVSQETNWAIITVKDNGKGIDPEFLPIVFEPFKQADKSMDRRYGGLGLGLSIVKGIAQVHGGRVKAYSGGIGKGSEFVISLPVHDEI